MAADLSAEARVFLMAGQSNMSGAGLWKELKESEKKPTAGVQIWHKGQWQDIGPGVSANEGRFGPELSFGREMKEAFPEDDIYLIKTAAGGTSMYKHWKVWDGQGPLLKRFLKTANAALENLEDEGIEYSIEGMIWMQGESDAAQGQGAVYEESLLKFIQAMRKEFDVREMPFVMGRILPTFDKPEGNGPMVRAAQEKVAAEDEKVACFDTDDFPRINKGHYNHEGQLMMGEAFAEHLLELLETTE
ncbi:MAG: sialate O-acetylesterase [Verrucomicrobiota bacterium JB023]|nr:sialate O-acetylesterase [Verrucomicrobiota bacterium JB023]